MSELCVNHNNSCSGIQKMGSVVGCCAVLAGRDWGEPNEMLQMQKETDHSDFFCRHSKLLACIRSMYCVWGPYYVQL